jgi:hypothetical protein
MKIYEVKVDVTECQIIQRDDHEELHEFACRKMSGIWIPENWYIYNPLDNKTHFYATPGATIIFDEFIRESDLGSQFEMSGEILSISIEGDNYYFLNVIGCINALNKQMTTYEIYDDGSISSVINTYSFYPQRIGGNPLFKIPETCRFQILCFEGILDPWDEFKGRYEQLGLKGLKFIELYDSDNENTV